MKSIGIGSTAFVRLVRITDPSEVIRRLLEEDEPVNARELIEATIYRPARGRKWIAVFTGPEPGKQIWRSTGLEDYNAALALAKQWEKQARLERLARKLRPRPISQRVKRRPVGQSGVRFPVSQPLSQLEVAALLGLSEKAVRNAEKRALAKLRAHPLVRRLFREYFGAKLDEASLELGSQDVLNRADIAALYGLARSQLERRALARVLVLIGAAGPFSSKSIS